LDSSGCTVQPCALKVGGVGVLGRVNRARIARYVIGLLRLLDEHSMGYVIDDSLKEVLTDVKYEHFKKPEEFPPWADLLVIFGGDGTILRAVHTVPLITERFILGVNVGTVGFLTEIDPERLNEAVLHVLKGGEVYVERSRLLSSSLDGKREFHMLNELMVVSSSFGRVMTFEIYKDDATIYRGSADGLVISTRTGSTAYIASLGGPVVDPEVELLLLSLLCPLRWGFRPMILPPWARIKVKVLRPGGRIIGDGIELTTIKGSFMIGVRLSNRRVNFIRFSRNSFYNRLNRRLSMEI